jgi:hypothetical protein
MTETGAGAAMIASREPRKVGTACFGKAGPRLKDPEATAQAWEAGYFHTPRESPPTSEHTLRSDLTVCHAAAGQTTMAR